MRISGLQRLRTLPGLVQRAERLRLWSDATAGASAWEVIFPVGYRNRFGHPKEDVVARYVASGARLHRSDLHGALRVDLTPAGLQVHRQRDESRRYWHGETP